MIKLRPYNEKLLIKDLKALKKSDEVDRKKKKKAGYTIWDWDRELARQLRFKSFVRVLIKDEPEAAVNMITRVVRKLISRKWED